MLSLTRKSGQSVLIGPDIRVTISRASGETGKVSLGIEAPSDLVILREEIAHIGQEMTRPESDQVYDKMPEPSMLEEATLIGWSRFKRRILKTCESTDSLILQEIYRRMSTPLDITLVPAAGAKR